MSRLFGLGWNHPPPLAIAAPALARGQLAVVGSSSSESGATPGCALLADSIPKHTGLFRRAVLAMLNVHVQYRPETLRGLASGPVLVTCNHLSFIDGVVIALASPWPLTFTSEPAFCVHTWWSRLGMAALARLGLGSVVPLDASRPLGLRNALRVLQQGGRVMIFPEGAISLDGSPRTECPGAAWLAHRAGCPTICLQLVGAQRSRLFARAGTRWRPRIELVF